MTQTTQDTGMGVGVRSLLGGGSEGAALRTYIEKM
jgi:hypothetical protein